RSCGGLAARRPRAALRKAAARGARCGLGPPAREPSLARLARCVRAEARTARAGRERAPTDGRGQPPARGAADLAARAAARRGGARAAMDARPEAPRWRRAAAAP